MNNVPRLLTIITLLLVGAFLRGQDCEFKYQDGSPNLDSNWRATIRGNVLIVHMPGLTVSAVDKITLPQTGSPAAELSLNATGDAYEFTGILPAAVLDTMRTVGKVDVLVEYTPASGFGTFLFELFKPMPVEGLCSVGAPVFAQATFVHDEADGELRGTIGLALPQAPNVRFRIRDDFNNELGEFQLDGTFGTFHTILNTTNSAAFRQGQLFVDVDDGNDVSIASAPITPIAYRRHGLGDGGQVVPPVSNAGTLICDVQLLPDNRLSAQIFTFGTNANSCSVHVGAVGQNGPAIFFPFLLAPGFFAEVSAPLTPAELQAFENDEIYVQVSGPTAQDTIRAQLVTRTPADVFGVGCPARNGERGTVLVPFGPTLGFGVQLTLIDAAPDAVAVHLVGFGDEGPYLSLAPMGSPGCFVMFTPLDMRGVFVTSPIGSTSDLLPVPVDASLVGTRLYSQWATIEPSPSSPWGLHVAASRTACVKVMQ